MKVKLEVHRMPSGTDPAFHVQFLFTFSLGGSTEPHEPPLDQPLAMHNFSAVDVYRSY